MITTWQGRNIFIFFTHSCAALDVGEHTETLYVLQRANGAATVGRAQIDDAEYVF